MSTVRIKHTKSKINVKLKEKESKFAIKTKKDDITLPAVVVFSGARGSGKTYACIMFVRHLEKKKYITRTFLLCPTRHSNDIYSNLKTLKDKDSFGDENQFNEALHHIILCVRKDWEEYDQALEYIKVYNKALRDPMSLTLQEQMVMEYHQGEVPQKVRKPAHMLIVDDAQGTSLYNNSRQDLLTHMVIKHRHIPISIAFMMQTWIGLPSPIRLNATQFMIYKTHDKNQIYQLYQSFGNLVTWDRFMEMYREATSSPHGFLYIDTTPKREEQRFRNGFNEYFSH